MPAAFHLRIILSLLQKCEVKSKLHKFIILSFVLCDFETCIPHTLRVFDNKLPRTSVKGVSEQSVERCIGPKTEEGTGVCRSYLYTK
jgi:hypothetical protein